VKENSIAWEAGIGRPIVVDGDEVHTWADGELVDTKAKKRQLLHYDCMHQTIRMQAELWNYLYPGTKKPKQQREMENFNYRMLDAGIEQWSSLAPDTDLKPLHAK
jgi:hypothetical protein